MAIREITTGQDSFLDIVANLVGVLIILVVVVGAQATSSWQVVSPNEDLNQEIVAAQVDLEQSAYVSRKLQLDNEELESKIRDEDFLAVQLSERRHRALVQNEVVRQQIKQQRVSLNDSQAEDFDRQERLVSLQSQLNELQREASAITASAPKTDVIDHHPNPIAKTVFSEEIHVRLAAGNLAVVPMDQLLDRMKAEWKVKSEKLKQSSRTTETVGPVGQFRLQYELGATMVQRKTREGVLQRHVVQLNQFILLPIREQIGNPLSQVLAETNRRSEFQKLLNRYEPARTTVSVWVYPDSYAQHNQLKDWLRTRGFQVASWPLAAGRPISGGPDGFRTSAQ